MGIGTLGFLKGASSQMLSSLEARDKAELEVKKQDKLDQLREDRIQQREMKEAVTFQTEKTPTGYDRVGYNKQGGEVIRRAANAPEVDAVKASEEDRNWLLKDRGMKEKDFEGDESERAQRMRLAAARDARDAGSSSLDNQYQRTLIAGAGGGKSGKANLSEVLDSIVSRNSKAIEELSGQEGVPLSDIQAGAWRFAEKRLQAGDSPMELERNFSTYLTELRKQAQKRGAVLDRYKRKPAEDTTSWRVPK